MYFLKALLHSLILCIKKLKTLEKGEEVLSDIYKIYDRADLTGKKQILSLIFPEDLIFDGEKRRTPRINEVLRLIID